MPDYFNGTLDKIVESMIYFLDDECGDGDVALLLGSKDSFDYVVAKIKKLERWAVIEDKGLDFDCAHFHDGSNENFMVTTSRNAFDKCAEYVLYKAEFKI